MHHIEICGNIASGKTTLAKLLKRLELYPVLERFRSNPFWQAFYADPVKFSFETEITFLLQHYHAIKVAEHNSKQFVCDFSLVLDRAYADFTLKKKRHRELFSSVANEAENELGRPKALIRLSCPEEVLLERIRKRKRSTEQAITIEFLATLGRSIKRRVHEAAKRVPIIEINSHRIDFAYSTKGKKEAIEQISDTLVTFSRSK